MIEILRQRIIEDVNLEVSMYKNNTHSDRPYSVRVFDLDANETVTVILCVTEAIALKYFNNQK